MRQTYADILGREMYVAASPQACALGSAVAAAVIAGQASEGHVDFASGQAAMTGVKDRVSTTNAAHRPTDDRPYGLYGQLHDAFGGVHDSAALGNTMKGLLERKEPSVSTQLS